jgi:hypothetical protein
MPEKRNISRDSETDRCIQRANGLLILAERELSAFMSAVDKCFGAEQARQSALDWIAELKVMDWPSGELVADWRQATFAASARLGTLGSRNFVGASESLAMVTGRRSDDRATSPPT